MENTTQTSAEPTIESLNLKKPPRAIHAMNHVHPAQAEEEADDESCPTCAAAKTAGPIQYVYALGRIQPRFPSIGIEKEFAQATSRTNTKGLTDNQVLQAILSEPQNRYLARQLCWIFSIEGLETYILKPMNSGDVDVLIESLNPSPRLTDVNVVIGVLGPIAPPQYCNGLQIPIVGFDQVYSFDVDALIKSIPKPEKITAKEFSPAAEELFMRIMQLADNAGATDDHRALNYIAVRYNAIYHTTSELFGRNFSLTSIEVRTSRLAGVRRIVDPILTFTNRNTDFVEKFFCRVDVTEEFPFLVSKMQPYFDR